MTRMKREIRRGFTLIEMLVVIALAALMATVVIVSLAGSYRAARTQDVAGQIAMYDRLAREHARRFGLAGRLVFDLGRGTVTRAAVEGGDAPASDGAALHLPAAVRLTRVVTAGVAASSGEVSIACSRGGQTPSYAICLTGAKAGEEYWIITAGLTGKTSRARDEREARDIFAAIAGNAAGDDAR